MQVKKFDPHEWIQCKKDQAPKLKSIPDGHVKSMHEEIEVIVRRVEASKLDLTANYADWITIGFAFAYELGELGRNYFHRISKFHPDYNMQNCNRQFDYCLGHEIKKKPIKISTFYFLAKCAGINIYVPKPE